MPGTASAATVAIEAEQIPQFKPNKRSGQRPNDAMIRLIKSMIPHRSTFCL